MSITKVIVEHDETKVLEDDGKPYLKIFGKSILNEMKELIKDGQNENEQNKLRGILLESISKRVRELMRADNFSVLTGAGSSIVLGGVKFSNSELYADGWVKEEFKTENEITESYNNLLKKFDPLKKLTVEEFLTILFRLEYAIDSGYEINAKVKEIKLIILNKLKNKCALTSQAETDGLMNHKTFIKRILSRPVNLRRTNLFTTNYDLTFEQAMDKLGVIYVDGFIGGLKKYFHPESFNFDYYYPAATTEGNVSRMERVLHFYKMHGSLNWIQTKEKDTLNIYNIEKKDTEQLDADNVLIYPTPMKESDTIGFPYSELFRRFANIIQQPQSVLITYGYSFGDAHINRIIYEALTIPSFQLLIVSYSWTESIKQIYRQFINEPSVGFIIGEDFASWDTFVKDILPDLPTQDLEDVYENKRNNAKELLKK